jgi:hypothetical protein
MEDSCKLRSEANVAMMKRKWVRYFAVYILGILLLFVALWVYLYALVCDWPDIDDLIREPGLYGRAVDLGLDPQATTQLEIVAAQRIHKKGVANLSFNPDRDFIEFASPESSMWWRFENGMYTIASQREVQAAVSEETDMYATLRGEYAKVFRYVLSGGGSRHACALAQVDMRGGMNYYEFWIFLRIGPGSGPWFLISRGGTIFGY